MTTGTVEGEIRARVASWLQHSLSGQIEQIMAHYAPTVRAFDAIGTREFDGAEVYRAHWAECLKHMTEEMSFEALDVRVEAADGLAVAHFIMTCHGPGPDGVAGTSYLRGTQVYRQHGDDWRVVHEHFSMPMDPATGQCITGA